MRVSYRSENLYLFKTLSEGHLVWNVLKYLTVKLSRTLCQHLVLDSETKPDRHCATCLNVLIQCLLLLLLIIITVLPLTWSCSYRAQILIHVNSVNWHTFDIQKRSIYRDRTNPTDGGRHVSASALFYNVNVQYKGLFMDVLLCLQYDVGFAWL